MKLWNLAWCDKCGRFKRIVHQYQSYNSYYKRNKMHVFCASCVKQYGYNNSDLELRVAYKGAI